MNLNPAEVPALLRAFRRARGLSQSQAARVLGISQRTLENWEQGIHTPRGLALAQLSQLLQNSAAQPTTPPPPCASKS